MFHFVASTGRTATTYLAAALNAVEGLTGTHEGQVGGAEDAPLLPLINLENRSSYLSPETAADTVRAKRSAAHIRRALENTGDGVLVDVAYYNATIAMALLEQHPESRMIGILRDCGSFVRSATAMSGEDLLPVGWPDPGKTLTPREQFIGMGRIRPAKDSADGRAWASWSAIRRNIWLWRETNGLILRAAMAFPERCLVLPFSRLASDPDQFWQDFLHGLALDSSIPISPEATDFRNRKASGYQVPDPTSWTANEQTALDDANGEICKMLQGYKSKSVLSR